MAYSDFVAGLTTQLGTVTTPQELTVLDHEPTSIQAAPGVYFVLTSFDRKHYAGMISIHYSIRVRVCVSWQENQAATRLIDEYVNTVPAAIEADPHLAGDTTKTLVLSGQTGWVTISGTEYYVSDTLVDGFETGAIGTL